jgi:hypothetical protein
MHCLPLALIEWEIEILLGFESAKSREFYKIRSASIHLYYHISPPPDMLETLLGYNFIFHGGHNK